MKRLDNLKELREKDAAALAGQIKELEKKLLDLRFQTAFRKVKNVKEVRDTRHQIARLHTILREKLEQTVSNA